VDENYYQESLSRQNNRYQLGNQKNHHFKVRSESPLLKFKSVVNEKSKLDTNSNYSSISRKKENRRYQSFDEFDMELTDQPLI